MLEYILKEIFMTILLINNNPIVSRLFALCAKEDRLVIDEFSDVASITKDYYDIVFVDETSSLPNVVSYLGKLELKHKVIISYQNNSVVGFDETIKKPFLPRQIMKIIEVYQKQVPTKSIDTPILNHKEIDRIKELLLMDEAKEEHSDSADDIALLEATIKAHVLGMKPKKIKNFLKGKPIKIIIQQQEAKHE